METGQTAAKKSTAKKTWTVIGNILIWLFIIFAVVVTVLAFAAQTNNDGVPTIGGKVILTVLTPSMEPGEYPGAPKFEDSFYEGDIIIGQKLSPDEQKSLQVGDVISYNAGDLNNDGYADDINSHRIVEVMETSSGVMYRTKGDHNTSADATFVGPEMVIAKYTGTRIPKLGTFLQFLQTQTGFLVCVVIPLVLFFIYELVMFILKFKKLKNAGKKQITAADEELIKQKAIEEYLKSQQAQAQTPPAEQKNELEKAEELVETAKKNAIDTAEEVKSDASEVETKAEEAVSEVETKAEETVSEAETKAEESVSEVETKAEETVSEVETKAEETVSEAETKAEETVSEAVQDASGKVQEAAEKTQE